MNDRTKTTEMEAKTMTSGRWFLHFKTAFDVVSVILLSVSSGGSYVSTVIALLLLDRGLVFAYHDARVP